MLEPSAQIHPDHAEAADQEKNLHDGELARQRPNRLECLSSERRPAPKQGFEILAGQAQRHGLDRGSGRSLLARILQRIGCHLHSMNLILTGGWPASPFKLTPAFLDAKWADIRVGRSLSFISLL